MTTMTDHENDWTFLFACGLVLLMVLTFCTAFGIKENRGRIEALEQQVKELKEGKE